MAPKNPAFPSLDRNAGFRLTFELDVHLESHSSNDRAGFSVILLAGDLQGIELGFWDDTIFAQSGSSFTHAEEVSYASPVETKFDLLILGDLYQLSANGTAILSGALRDYSSFGLPYNLPNYLFLGDDTSSAGADVTLGDIALTPGVPEPGEWALVAIGIGALCFMTRRIRRTPRHMTVMSPIPRLD